MSPVLSNHGLTRPHSVGPDVPEYVNTDTEVGDFVLLPGFKRTIEAYYKQATDKDKAKCLELLTSLKLGKKIRAGASQLQRPKTTMSLTHPARTNLTHAYLSTYKREHGPQQPRKPIINPDDPVFRLQTGPMDERSGRCPKRTPSTHYTEEFFAKDQKPATPIRSGTSSGYRNNNPHPLPQFMNWRVPRSQETEITNTFISPYLTDEKVRQINKHNFESTYQRDFIGAPQGFQLQTAFEADDKDWMMPPYGKESLQRFSYGQPKQEPILQVPTTRYASNRKKHIAAFGIAPVCNEFAMNVYNRTTYDKVYNATADSVHRRIRDIAHNLSGNTLRQYYNSAQGPQKEMLARMLAPYNDSTDAPSKVASPRSPSSPMMCDPTTAAQQDCCESVSPGSRMSMIE